MKKGVLNLKESVIYDISLKLRFFVYSKKVEEVWYFTFQGSLTRDFRLHVFFMNQFFLDPWVYHSDVSNIFESKG